MVQGRQLCVYCSAQAVGFFTGTKPIADFGRITPIATRRARLAAYDRVEEKKIDPPDTAKAKRYLVYLRLCDDYSFAATTRPHTGQRWAPRYAEILPFQR